MGSCLFQSACPPAALGSLTPPRGPPLPPDPQEGLPSLPPPPKSWVAKKVMMMMMIPSSPEPRPDAWPPWATRPRIRRLLWPAQGPWILRLCCELLLPLLDFSMLLQSPQAVVCDWQSYAASSCSFCHFTDCCILHILWQKCTHALFSDEIWLKTRSVYPTLSWGMFYCLLHLVLTEKKRENPPQCVAHMKGMCIREAETKASHN